ncbi:unnamed protein product [Protopolystoma xenopodis]|uniref:Uncharacterized protein n=1 Tax=Protopolystoma xenopodis TaxID=117903 RepID=A0A448X4W8_9PLAT|nr:unnamed protein product [Protopolystoma xenopodis]
MEREISQLLSNHKAELGQMRRECAEQIRSADERAFSAYTQQMEELRAQLLHDKEEACTREREMASERFALLLPLLSVVNLFFT